MSQNVQTIQSRADLFCGITLRRRIRDYGALSVTSAARIIRQLADPVDRCHQRGEVFGRICPENVWFLLSGEAVLFRGCAPTEWDPSNNAPIGYLSPEEARGEPPTPATDIWALGCLLYEMLVGLSPHQVVSNMSPSMKTFITLLSTPPAAPTVLGRSLTWSGGDRYPSAAAMADELLLLPATNEPTDIHPEIVSPAAKIPVLDPPAPGAEELRGVTLRRRLRTQGPLSLAEASRLMDAIAESVDDMHHQGVRHGAICPDHIWVQLDGSVTLYTPAVDARDEMQEHLTRIGYLSPEEEAGEQPTRAADIWALGVLLFEVLMGDGASPSRPGHAGVPGELSASVSAAEVILDEALAEAPEERFPSAQALANALWELVPDHGPDHVRPHETPEPSVVNDGKTTDPGLRLDQAVNRAFRLSAGTAAPALGSESAARPRRRAPRAKGLSLPIVPKPPKGSAP